MTKKAPLAHGHSSPSDSVVAVSWYPAPAWSPRPHFSAGGRGLRAADMADEIRWYTWGTYYKPFYMEGFTEAGATHRVGLW